MNSILRDKDYYGEDFLLQGAIPGSISSARWTYGSEGYEQQTFLGCTIRNFNINGEFGDSSSTLSVSLVPDEYNRSDGTGLGMGDDVYHNGMSDKLVQLPPGTPVFFKFGKKRSNTDDAWLPYIKDIYGSDYTVEVENQDGNITQQPVFIDGPENIIRYEVESLNSIQKGHYVDIDASDFLNHKYSIVDLTQKKNDKTFVFGGILQSITKNRSDSANPSYEVNVTDPREILSNVNLILNNYTNSNFGLPNLYNIYGFLEYEPTKGLLDDFEKFYELESELRKEVDEKGNVKYVSFPEDEPLFKNFDFGYLTDCYLTKQFVSLLKQRTVPINQNSSFPQFFPKTGVGLSRRSDLGIPFYKILHGILALNGFWGELPKEYLDKSFGSYINFRGFNYVVDLSGIPLNKVPPFYHLEFEQINLLELVQEICDVINHDFFVSLIPITNHPYTKHLYQSNSNKILNNDKNIIAGVIRIDTIDRSKKLEYGSVERYINTLKEQKIEISNDNTGFELSNIVTDKFVVGAQEVNLHFFDTYKDRLKQDIRNEFHLGDQWTLPHMLGQQVLPFYGFLGKNCISIPRGHGSYQQILLDARELQADGVGPYYVATEIELRAAAISYESWRDFLLKYNDLYLESMETDDIEQLAKLQQVRKENVKSGFQNSLVGVSDTYGVSVPRSTFDTYDVKLVNGISRKIDKNGFPFNTCNPPFGYPLYYKRASSVGIPESGLVGFVASRTNIVTNLASLKAYSEEEFRKIINSDWSAMLNDLVGLSPEEKELIDQVKTILSQGGKKDEVIGLIESKTSSFNKIFKQLSDQVDRQIENSMKVYNFVKQAADNLGKKFLVKIPKKTNPFYQKSMFFQNNIAGGPFGFKPRFLTGLPNAEFEAKIDGIKSFILENNIDNMKNMLQEGVFDPYDFYLSEGALRCNYSSILDEHVFNYVPNQDGGFFDFDIKKNFAELPYKQLGNIYIPPDLTNFLNENRVGPYVRFNNSQNLDLSGLSKDSYFQVFVKDNKLVPDINYSLENILEDSLSDFPNGNVKKVIEAKPKSVVFVKCSVDNNFYMPPKIKSNKVAVYGRRVKNIDKITPPRKIFNRDTGKMETALGIYEAQFVPDQGGWDGTLVDWYEFETDYSKDLNSRLIDTKLSNLDDDHVYALITIDGNVKANMDMLYADGIHQEKAPVDIKHFLTLDVVKYVPGFDEPASPTIDQQKRVSFEDYFKNYNFPEEVNQIAFLAYRQVMKSLNSDQNSIINVTFPSPIYPDLVAIPLMSKDYCYGPWISSMINPEAARYKTVPGKIEFIKEESLSPWNYHGYDLMDEAARLVASFGNSLMLFGENGSFTFSDLPRHNLLQSLEEGGPLVSSISVSMGPEGVQTTYNLNLYTPSFGKLDKQKKDLISKISRERQKMVDEKNKNARIGFSKSANKNYTNINKRFDSLKSIDNFTSSLKETASIINSHYLVESYGVVEQQAVVINGEEKQTEVVRSETRPVNADKNRRTSAMYASNASNTNANLARAEGMPFEACSMDSNTFLPDIQDPGIDPIFPEGIA